jgi:flagellar protein FlaG
MNPLPAVSQRPPPAAVPEPAVMQSNAGSQGARSESERLRELEAELAAANHKLAGDGNELRFEFDREASRLIVRLVDVGTREVLRQFPSDEALRVARLVRSGKPVVSMQA